MNVSNSYNEWGYEFEAQKVYQVVLEWKRKSFNYLNDDYLSVISRAELFLFQTDLYNKFRKI